MNPPSYNPFLQQVIPKLVRFYDKYNRTAFIEKDPISIPHLFKDEKDIEIIAFLVALITWGKRENVIRSAKHLVYLLENSPYDFVLYFDSSHEKYLKNFVHRTFNGEDLISILWILKKLYKEGSSLRAIFEQAITLGDEHVGKGIISLRNYFVGNGLLKRTYRFFPDIEKGSAAKRINMFLRWMVRKDDRGVDLGIWKGIQPCQLLIPLDVHTGNVARNWGLLQRKHNDFQAVIELTRTLKLIDPQDPVKFDFALFGAGIFKEQDL
jgi:uncharacterized protein (TIGR02757 family)